MKPTIVVSILVSVSVVFPSALHAQTLPFRTYTMADGLPSNIVLALCQDSRGFLWIGTDEGVSVFDGATFTNYTVANGLPFGRIGTIIESNTIPGAVWVGTHGGGLARIEKEKVTVIPLGPDPVENIIDAILEDRRGVLWCVTHKGLTKVINDTAFSILVAGREKGGRAAFGMDSLIWVGIDRQVFIFDGDSLLSSIDLPLPDESLIAAICPDSGDCMWIGAEGGFLLRVHRDGVIDKYRPFTSSIAFMTPQSDGKLLVGVWNVGIWQIQNSEFPDGGGVWISDRNGLPENSLSCGLRDREGVLWLGGFNKGLCKLADDNVSTFRFEKDRSVKATVVDNQGHLWAFDDGGVTEFWKNPKEQWQWQKHSLNSIKGAKHSAVKDHQGNIWVVRLDGTVVSFTIVPSEIGPSKINTRMVLQPDVHIPQGDPSTVMVDRDDRLWYASDFLAVIDVKREPRLLRMFSAKDGFPVDGIRALYEDDEQNIWCGTFAKGLSVLPKGDWQIGEFKVITTEDGLPDNGVRSIHQDRNGTLWIGTRYGGLAFIGGRNDDPLTAIRKGNLFGTFSVKDGLISNAVWDIAEDTKGSLLLGLYGGVQKLDPHRMSLVKTYRPLLGINVGACGIFKDEFFWCTTLDALVLYDLAQARADTIPPPIYLRRLIVNGQEVNDRAAMEFQYTQNTCTIEFIGVSLRDERGVRYEYRLVDQDTTWLGPIADRSVTFAKLAPGTYNFEVRARNADGISSSQTAGMSFTILSPFWQRWWFASLALFLAVGIGTIVVRARIRRILELNRLRTRIAQDLHDDVGSNLTGIAIASKIVQEREARGEKSQLELLEISVTAMRTLDMMRDIVWLINPANDSLDDLVMRMRETTSTILGTIDFVFHPPSTKNGQTINLEIKRNMFLMFKEILTNIVKHSRASSVAISCTQHNRHLHVKVEDNGVGFDPSTLSKGNGIRNLKNRSGAIKAIIEIDSRMGEGTRIAISAPLT